jgi:hypothetical protein
MERNLCNLPPAHLPFGAFAAFDPVRLNHHSWTAFYILSLTVRPSLRSFGPLQVR